VSETRILQVAGDEMKEAVSEACELLRAGEIVGSVV
jgi:hypothetical protein